MDQLAPGREATGPDMGFQPTWPAAELLGNVLAWVCRRVPYADPHIPVALAQSQSRHGSAAPSGPQPLADAADTHRLCWHHGLLLAALYALDARDAEAGGSQPPGDRSGLRAPDDGTDPAAVMLAASVARTGPLEAIRVAARQLSQGAAALGELEAAMLAGFRLGYDAIAAHREEFTRLLPTADDSGMSHLPRQPALDRALAKVAGLSEVDRRDQEWVISATLAPLLSPRGQQTAVLPSRSLKTIAAEPARLLATACGLADQIVSHGITAPSGQVNWLSLHAQGDDEWNIAPMGAGLGHGYLGVALYLAQLADLTKIARYAEVARQALCPIPSVLTTLNSHSEMLMATGCGGYQGLGGFCYGLARMATLLRDGELEQWAATAVRLTTMAATQPARPGWADGTAGCLAAMTAVWSETGSRDAAGLARTTASRLAELVDETDGWCVPDSAPGASGFASGPAGVAAALALFAAASGEPAFLQAGRRAVRRAASLAKATDSPAVNWCHGTAGVLVARCLADEVSAEERRTSLLALTDRPVRADLSLCTGEFGITEALRVLSRTDRTSAAQQVLRRRTGQLLDALHRRARYCGTPGGVVTPGLLNGLAGIGYGLLRAGFPERVPALLTLSPTPIAKT